MMRPGFVLLTFFAWLLPSTVIALLPSSARSECAKWDINGEWVFAQNNGFNTTFHLRQDGTELSGDASYISLKSKSQSEAVGSKSLTGTFDHGTLIIRVEWNNGAVGVYTGGISAEGRFAGAVKDDANPGSATGWSQLWHNGSDFPATCVAEATPPQAPPPPKAPSSPPASETDKLGVINKPGGMGVGEIVKQTTTPPSPPAPMGGTTTVIADVDVYKAPGGLGKPIGVLRSNNQTTKVSLVAPCQDSWCHVKGDPVPTGEGWVYSGTPPDFQSLQF